MSGLDTEQLHRLVPFSAELGIRLLAAGARAGPAAAPAGACVAGPCAAEACAA